MIVNGKEDLSGPVLGDLNERLGAIDYVICHSDSFSHMRSLKKRMDEWSKPTIVSGCFMYSSSEKKLEILNDHYKDTFSHLVSYRKQRDRLLLYLLGLVVIMWLYELFPDEMSAALSKIASEKTGVTKVESIISNVLKELPMLCAVFLAFRYWQTWHLIESQYDYLEKSYWRRSSHLFFQAASLLPAKAIFPIRPTVICLYGVIEFTI